MARTLASVIGSPATTKTAPARLMPCSRAARLTRRARLATMFKRHFPCASIAEAAQRATRSASSIGTGSGQGTRTPKALARKTLHGRRDAELQQTKLQAAVGHRREPLGRKTSHARTGERRVEAAAIREDTPPDRVRNVQHPVSRIGQHFVRRAFHHEVEVVMHPRSRASGSARFGSRTASAGRDCRSRAP